MVPGGSGRARTWNQQLIDWQLINQRLGSRIPRPRRGGSRPSVRRGDGGLRRRPANVQPRRSRLGSCPGYYWSCPNPPGACASEDRCETGCVDQGAFMVCDRHSASGHRRIVFTRRWRLGRRRPPITSSACLDSVVWNCCLPVQKIRKFFYLNSRKEVIVVSLAIP